MKTALVIVNGIKFPYFLTDRAIAWAKQEQGRLQALFLTSDKEMSEGYAFPSDMSLAETVTNTRDAEKDSMSIMHDQINLFNAMIISEGVSGSAELLNEPTLEQVLEKATGANLLFVAPGYGETAPLAITRFSLQELIDKAPCPVEKVSNQE